MTSESKTRALRVLILVAKVLLALAFLMLGAEKLSGNRVWIRIFDQIGFGQWFRYFTGAVQVAGALLLLIPRTALIGVALLASTMIGALLVQALVIGIGPQSGPASVLLLLLLAIGAPELRRLARLRIQGQ